ncbi:MAG: hypothetical protein ABIQ39_01585 [Ilumatobacteraceae bacterium]
MICLPFGFKSGDDIGPNFYFQVADAAAIGKRVAELGGSHGHVFDSDAGLSLTSCTAPGDVAFELWQPAPGFTPA